MRSKKSWNRIVPFLIFGIVAALALAAPTCCMAAGEGEGQTEKKDSGEAHGEESVPTSGIVALAAALAIGLTAIATGIAQARIGSAGIGAIAENPKRLGAVIMLVAIPETVAILGFVVAYLILSGA